MRGRRRNELENEGLMALKTVVLEIGSVYVKAGFAGEASPRVVYNAGLRDWLRDEGARPHHRRSTRKTTTTTSRLGEEEGEGKREKEGEGEEDADGVVLRGGREQASDASWRALLGPLLQEVLVRVADGERARGAAPGAVGPAARRVRRGLRGAGRPSRRGAAAESTARSRGRGEPDGASARRGTRRGARRSRR